jgi:hypothetical protein
MDASRRATVMRAAFFVLLVAVAALLVTAGAGARSLRTHGSVPAVPPPAKIRVANFYLVGRTKPGPALDFYDTQQPGKADKPLISNLGYGQISAYVSPRADAGYSNLYVYPAGSKTWGKPFDGTRTGTNISSSGWVAGQQETVVMGTDLSTPQPTFATVAEVEPKSADLKSALLRPAVGKGLLAVNVSGLIEGTSEWPDVDLRIDGFCPDNIETNGKPAQHSNVSPEPAMLADYNAADFPLSPGKHELSVVDNPAPGNSPAPAQALTWEECKTAPSLAGVGVTITTRTPTLVFLFGTSPATVSTLVAKVG